MTDRLRHLRADMEASRQAGRDVPYDAPERKGIDRWQEVSSGAFNEVLKTVLSERVTYHLSFTRDETRHFGLFGLAGADIPCAFDPRRVAAGSWDDEEFGDRIDCEDDAIRESLKVAVAEAVHEVLEWFKVDGKPFLNPHGKQSEDIIAACYELGERFFDTGMRASEQDDEQDEALLVPTL